jgi:hypothetical protein
LALETQIIEFPFAQGLNEGIQREVQPLGQLSVLKNARFRRDGRLCKRFGYELVTLDDLDGTEIGTDGEGYVTALGDGFVVIDDRFYVYDETADAWALKPFELTSGGVHDAHLTNSWPQFLPAPSFSPLSVQSDLDVYGVYGTDVPSTASMTQAGGILYTSCAFWRYDPPGAGSWIVRVAGTDQETGRNVFQQDILASGDQSDVQHHHLLSTGDGTVVLVTDHFTAAAKDGIRIRLMTDRTVGFGSEHTVACLESAVNYYVGDATHILITYSVGTAFTNTGNWSVGTQSFTHLETDTTGAEGIPERLSVYGVSGGLTFVGFYGATSTNHRIRTYNSALASLTMLSALEAKFGFASVTSRILFAVRPDDATTVTVVVCGEDASGYRSMGITDATSAAYTGQAMVQAWTVPLSWPFPVGDHTHMWVRHDADPLLGVATLVRVPYATEFGSGVTPFSRSLPIEATLDDQDIDSPVEPEASGPTFPTPLATTLGYIALFTPTVETFVSDGPVTQALTRPLLVPVRHRSESAYQAQACVVPVVGKQFVASAQPMFVGARGAVEAGFVQAPTAPEFVSNGAGGDLTADSRYLYCAVFEYADASGRIERSAPSLPLAASTVGGNQTLTITVGTLELSKKILRVKVYRTKANQTTFFFLASFDATPAENIGNPYTLEDASADDVVGSNEQLYTQIGQELPASQFPACQFATEADGRLWTGGGFRANVIQASKFFHPRLSVEFCDDDAFRVSLPADCTGLAWLDNLVAFTNEGIYVIAGGGPDGSGVGFFDVTRLPTSIGCINWRSVIATDEGIFFQSARGLCLLPRGFAEPVLIDQVVTTLATYKYITSAKVVTGFATTDEPPIRTVQWACLSSDDADSATAGVVIVYDPARKVWSVDTFEAAQPGTLLACWDGARLLAQGKLTADTHQLRLESETYADDDLAITRTLRTGDLRPWGSFAHGVINRVGIIHDVVASCTLSVTMTTENGASTTTKAYTTTGTAYLEASLNRETLRDVNFLRVELSESGTTAGTALIHMVAETDIKAQGFKLEPIGNRVT